MLLTSSELIRLFQVNPLACDFSQDIASRVLSGLLSTQTTMTATCMSRDFPTTLRRAGCVFLIIKRLSGSRLLSCSARLPVRFCLTRISPTHNRFFQV